MEKLFAVAGVSTLEGVIKARFAKDMGRVKVLEKNGHTNVKLVELPKLMDKVAATAWLRSHKAFQDAAIQAVLNQEDTAPVAKPAKAPKAAKVKAVAKVTAKTPKTPEEVEVIRAKNLETIRKVGKSWIKQWEEDRATVGEAMLEDAASIMDAIEGEMPAFLKKDSLYRMSNDM